MCIRDRVEQVESTFLLPEDLVFSDKADLVEQGGGGEELTILDSPKLRDFPFKVEANTIDVELPYLLFNKSGRLEVPFFSESDVHIAISEGYLENQKKVLIGNKERDRSELIRLNYQTGALTTLVR